ncbi:GLRX2 protein, partial [Polypterus senegalus]
MLAVAWSLPSGGRSVCQPDDNMHKRPQDHPHSTQKGEVVDHNCIVIFSKTTCPYCHMAKNVFNEIGISYKVIELDQHQDGKQLQEVLGEMTGEKTGLHCKVALNITMNLIGLNLFSVRPEGHSGHKTSAKIVSPGSYSGKCLDVSRISGRPKDYSGCKSANSVSVERCLGNNRGMSCVSDRPECYPGNSADTSSPSLVMGSHKKCFSAAQVLHALVSDDEVNLSSGSEIETDIEIESNSDESACVNRVCAVCCSKVDPCGKKIHKGSH